jgi:hypothetical protein
VNSRRCRTRTTLQRHSRRKRSMRCSMRRAERLQTLHAAPALLVRRKPTRATQRQTRRDASLAGRMARERGWRTRLRSRLSRVSGHVPDLHANTRIEPPGRWGRRCHAHPRETERLHLRAGRRRAIAVMPGRKPHRTVGLDVVVKVVTLLCSEVRASLVWSVMAASSSLAGAATNADRASTCHLTATRAKCVTSVSQLLRVADARSLRGLVKPVYHPCPDPLARLEHRSGGQRAVDEVTVGAARV